MRTSRLFLLGKHVRLFDVSVFWVFRHQLFDCIRLLCSKNGEASETCWTCEHVGKYCTRDQTYRNISNTTCSFWTPGAALGYLLEFLGRPWDAFWDPWATLRGPLGALWVPKGRPPHTGTKRNRHKQNNIPLWATFGPKMVPQGDKMRPKSYICFGLKCTSKFEHFLGAYFRRKL